MKHHTTFGVGGPADIYTLPESREELAELIVFAHGEGLPLYILGGGANILVSDTGIRGLVVDMAKLSTVRIDGTHLVAEAGAEISEVSRRAGEEGLTGLEFIYKMPGSTGGALWMNARCYGVSVSEVVEQIEYVDGKGAWGNLSLPHPDFSYKRSPFQGGDKTVYRASFALRRGVPEEIRGEMERVCEDRKRKGHFAYPSAGSVFKNNRDFGRPTGVILDELGLKGTERGGAQIAPFHANIIINRGGANAEDIRYLVELARDEAFRRLAIELEPEIRFVGEWGGAE